MKVSYNILCELVPGLEKFPAKVVADKLTFSGLEVEGYEDKGAKLKGIVVGKTISVERHPNADKLSLCRVSAGKEEFQVVCGAPNVKAGCLYPFATLGTVMPSGLEIKPVKLRGVESFGMLCSARELELSEESNGLLDLSENLTVGEGIAKALALDDVIFELNVTPNRGDALSHWGVARDLSALFDLPVSFTNSICPNAALTPAATSKPKIKLQHKNPEACARFSVSEISNIKVGPSPQWLENRLTLLGQRPINNIVDATNYVMLITGHPVHAYDARDLQGGEIAVRLSTDQTKFKTLDGIERDILAGDLIIADASRVVGLAGVMGGENSQIKTDTTNIVLEVAQFKPECVRKTARRLGIVSESSYRFERFVNPETVILAHEILQNLIVTLGGGVRTSITDSYLSPVQLPEILLTANFVTRTLGIAIDEKIIVGYLTRLGCVVKGSGELQVTPPTARSDLTRAIDLVEEVARLGGLEKIPAVMPNLLVQGSRENKATRLAREIKNFLVQDGFFETVHYSFGEARVFESLVKNPEPATWVKLKNPLSEELAVMRPSLLPHLLQSYVKNRRHSEKALKLFELRHVYHKKDGKALQREVMAGVMGGVPLGRNRFGLNRALNFDDVNGLVTRLCDLARLGVVIEHHKEWPFHPGQAIAYLIDGRQILRAGVLHPQILLGHKIKENLCYFEVEYEFFSSLFGQERVSFKPVSPLPPVYRDLAVVVDENLSFLELKMAIEALKPRELKAIELFDVYHGENLPNGKKSLAFSIIYESDAENMTDEAVNKIHFELVDKLKAKLNIELR